MCMNLNWNRLMTGGLWRLWRTLFRESSLNCVLIISTRIMNMKYGWFSFQEKICKIMCNFFFYPPIFSIFQWKNKKNALRKILVLFQQLLKLSVANSPPSILKKMNEKKNRRVMRKKGKGDETIVGTLPYTFGYRTAALSKLRTSAETDQLLETVTGIVALIFWNWLVWEEFQVLKNINIHP